MVMSTLKRVQFLIEHLPMYISEKLCPALVQPFRASISPDICNNKRGNIRRNTECSYSCPVGYQLTYGSSKRTCQINGTFDGKSPYCRRKFLD